MDLYGGGNSFVQIDKKLTNKVEPNLCDNGLGETLPFCLEESDYQIDILL